jgi:aminobenzoyl-glutamate utilization protein B
MTKAKRTACRWIDENRRTYEGTARYIWENPELSLVEYKSSEKLQEVLRTAGFKVVPGVSGMPTAFVASWGSRKPLVGFLAEFDALPNLSQKAGFTRQSPVVPGGPGHGCGHNLLGASICAAAVAAKTSLEKHRIPGTVKVFGCPAEETLVGKIFMARDGVFDGTDAIIAWHPGDLNGVDYNSMLAMTSAKFRFKGRSAHAASAPHAGRNALDAVELMDIAMKFMRGHIIQEARVMSVVSRGGEVPNNVPPDAEVWYFLRAPRRAEVDRIWDWAKDIAKGAALMTQTKTRHSILAATWEVLPNRVLAEIGLANVSHVGPPPFTPEDQRFGREVLRSSGRQAKGSAFDEEITLPDLGKTFPDVDVYPASTDLGNVSWLVPTLSFKAATLAKGTALHSWQTVSQSCSAPAMKAGLTVAKWMAASALDFFTDSEAVRKAWEEHQGHLSATPYRHPIDQKVKLPSHTDLYGDDSLRSHL